MTRAELIVFLRQHRLAVQASVSPTGAPQAAVVGFAVSDDLEFIFDTDVSSRKIPNLRANEKIALVIGWDEECTVQVDGVADEPKGEELSRIQKIYFDCFPDGPSRLAWPGITYIRVRPTWIRYSDFREGTRQIVEWRADDLRSKIAHGLRQAKQGQLLDGEAVFGDLLRPANLL